MDAIPWDYFAHNTDAERAAASRAQQRRWEEQERLGEWRAAQIERERKEQLFKFFYGAAAEVSLREFPGFKPFATVETKAGAKITVQETQLTVDNRDKDSIVASILLAHAMWGGASAGGSKKQQMGMMAFGLALGVKVRGKDQDTFTERDKAVIGRMAQMLQAKGVQPNDPRKQAASSVQLWPQANL